MKFLSVCLYLLVVRFLDVSEFSGLHLEIEAMKNICLPTSVEGERSNRILWKLYVLNGDRYRIVLWVGVSRSSSLRTMARPKPADPMMARTS